MDRLESRHIEELVRRIGGNTMAKLGRPNASGYATIQCCFHEDRTPSLRINVANGGGYRCYGCGAHGDFFHLVSHASGAATFPDQMAAAAELVGLGEYDKLRSDAGWYSYPPERKPFITKVDYDFENPQAFPHLPEADVARVDEMVVRLEEESISYLHGEKRRLTDVTIKKWKLGWHPSARRVSIPQYDFLGRLVNIGGRFIPSIFDSWSPPPWMHAMNFRKELFIFGEQQFKVGEQKLGTMFLVEGMFDAIYLDQAGVPNVGAMLGSHASKCQADKMVKWFDRIVIIPDGDTAGYTAAAQVEKILGDRVKVERYDTAMGLDPDELSDEDIYDIRRRFGD